MDFYVLAINGAIFRIVPASFASANPTPYTFSTLNSQGQQQHLQSLSTLPANITNKVTIVGVKGTNSYDPNPIYIKAGDTVTWINVDVIAHTVTSGKDYNRLTSGLLFHSGSIISNTAYSHTFNIPGIYDYVCMFHPDMKGEVVVVSK